MTSDRTITINFCTDGTGALLTLDPDALYVLETEDNLSVEEVREIGEYWPEGYPKPLILAGGLHFVRVATEADLQ